MKNIYVKIAVVVLAFLTFSCSDKWDEHYLHQEAVVNNEMVKVVNGSVEDYIQSIDELSNVSNLFQEQGIFDIMETKDQLFTVLVYTNDVLSGATIDDPSFFTKTCVCDLGLIPSKLTDGYSIQMWNGKYLYVSVQDGQTGKEILVADSKLKSVVQADNGIIYYMDAPIYSPKSLYEVLNELGEDYSIFKQLVLSFEERVFDRENSVPVGIDATGNTIYDSTYVSKNLLMDRYNAGDESSWNMRSEFFSSTMLIPSNNILTQALEKAYEDVKNALNRVPTEADSTKFKEWIVRSAFYDQVLTPEQLNGTEDIYSVAGYKEEESVSTEGTQWKPTVQKVNAANPVKLSNGVAYYITDLKIPNNVVIHRIKNRFYYWEYCSAEEKNQYFKWTNFTNVLVYNMGSYGPIGPWPAVSYKCLLAFATAEAQAEKLPVSLECTGISLNTDGTIAEAKVPPGEYYLRMGFRSANYPWRLNIFFNDELVAESVNPNGAHFDRTAVGFPEGFVWRDWYATSNKSYYYDCDGMDIATVTVTGTGLQTVKFKFESNDLSQTAGTHFVAYCWTLRPTNENY